MSNCWEVVIPLNKVLDVVVTQAKIIIVHRTGAAGMLQVCSSFCITRVVCRVSNRGLRDRGLSWSCRGYKWLRILRKTTGLLLGELVGAAVS